MGKSILIIKLGASGDVLRTTSILNGLHKIDPEIDEVSWITNRECVPILYYSENVKHIVQKEYVNGLLDQEFDYAVNFDEDLEACDFLMMSRAKKKMGYTNSGGKYYPVDMNSTYAYQLSHDDNLKFKTNKKTYQQIIFEMCGIEWGGEFYDFNYDAKDLNNQYVALNTEVGDKWPTKKWPYWEDLMKQLDHERIHYENQRIFSNVEDYFEWISQARYVVTSDTFGMHIALAMKKPTLAIFGPTSPVEIEDYGIIQKIYDSTLECLPCYKAECPYNHECMKMIGVNDVMSKIKGEINGY